MAAPRLPQPQTSITDLLSLQRVAGEPILNAEQIEQLVALTMADGQPMLSLRERSFVYDLLGLISKRGFNQVFRHLTSRSWTRRDQIIWSSDFFDLARQDLQRETESFKEKVEVSKGVFTCSKCKGDRTVSTEVQTRSADEPMTVFVTCVSCQHRWRT